MFILTPCTCLNLTVHLYLSNHIYCFLYKATWFQIHEFKMAAVVSAAYNMESDISQLEAPTFSTLERNIPASMQALDWDHQVTKTDCCTGGWFVGSLICVS